VLWNEKPFLNGLLGGLTSCFVELPQFWFLLVFAVLTMRALAASQTFTGTITDTMCGKKHMSPGKSDADCTRDCMKLKGDWTYGLVVGKSVYRLAGDNKRFATVAGQQVTVAGDVTGTTIAVQTITPAK
jgi:hypothetical protein